MMAWRIVVSTVYLVVLTAGPALACPVCGAEGSEKNTAAYLVMSVVLSGLPLAMIGGVVFWLSRRVARHGAAGDRPRGQAKRPDISESQFPSAGR